MVSKYARNCPSCDKPLGKSEVVACSRCKASVKWPGAENTTKIVDEEPEVSQAVPAKDTSEEKIKPMMGFADFEASEFGDALDALLPKVSEADSGKTE